jgi:hypothetical protein
MTHGQRRARLTPAEQRADLAADAILEGSGLRYQSAQIPGLALILLAFVEREIQLRDLAALCDAQERTV